ncbi:MAG: TetR family transcriptional regulator C-terminal domain-containing protein [Saprospiraceae bacterium]
MFLDVRKNGYQGLRADKVIAGMDITKGALYHYFANKQAIGAAIIDELIRPRYLHFFQELAASSGNPIDKMQEHLRALSGFATEEDIALGCPLNNLVQEMSPIDEDFRLRMKSIVDEIHTCTIEALRRGQAAGLVRANVVVEQIAQFFFAGIEGAYSTAKVRKDCTAFQNNMLVLSAFLDTLRK